MSQHEPKSDGEAFWMARNADSEAHVARQYWASMSSRDRAAVEAGARAVAERERARIVAWLRERSMVHPMVGAVADAIEHGKHEAAE